MVDDLRYSDDDERSTATEHAANVWIRRYAPTWAFRSHRDAGSVRVPVARRCRLGEVIDLTAGTTATMCMSTVPVVPGAGRSGRQPAPVRRCSVVLAWTLSHASTRDASVSAVGADVTMLTLRHPGTCAGRSVVGSRQPGTGAGRRGWFG